MAEYLLRLLIHIVIFLIELLVCSLSHCLTRLLAVSSKYPAFAMCWITFLHLFILHMYIHPKLTWPVWTTWILVPRDPSGCWSISHWNRIFEFSQKPNQYSCVGSIGDPGLLQELDFLMIWGLHSSDSSRWLPAFALTKDCCYPCPFPSPWTFLQANYQNHKVLPLGLSNCATILTTRSAHSDFGCRFNVTWFIAAYGFYGTYMNYPNYYSNIINVDKFFHKWVLFKSFIKLSMLKKLMENKLIYLYIWKSQSISVPHL